MLSEHFKNEPSCALKSIERLTSGAIFTSYIYFIKGVGTGTGKKRGGGVALALPHFFGKVIHFLFVIKICDKSSLHFASDASVHYNPELTPEWFDKNTLNKRFYINFIFCSTVSSCRYENISHIYLLHYSIYIHVSIHLYIIYIYI